MDELDWLGSLPIISPSKSLVFRQEKDGVAPATLDDYAKANSIFFEVQSRLNFLFIAVQDMPPHDDVDEVAGRIQDALQELDALKCRQWLIRGGVINLKDWNNYHHAGDDLRAIVINTGEYKVSKATTGF